MIEKTVRKHSPSRRILVGAIIVVLCLQAWSLSAAELISSIAGNSTGTYGFAGDGGSAVCAQFSLPQGLAIDTAGNVYVADFLNNRVRKIAGNVITTIAGTGVAAYTGDGGLATAATLHGPSDVAIDGAGNIFIADRDNNCVRKIDAASGNISTVAGTGAFGYSGDNGSATNATLNSPFSVALDSAGNLYISDHLNHCVRRVSNPGTLGAIITTYAGTGNNGTSPDGGQADASNLSFPEGICFDSADTLYIAEEGSSRVRKVPTNGVLNTVAGNGTTGFGGDGGLATAAALTPSDVAVDSAGNVYIADFSNNRIRKVDAASGNIATVAGTGNAGYSGDGGPATSADLSGPQGLCLDGAGNVLLTSKNVRKVGPASGTAPAITSALSAGGQPGAAFSYTLTASGSAPVMLAAGAILPNGLFFDCGTISGSPTTAGTYQVTLTSSNSAGVDSKILTITVGNAPQITSALSVDVVVGAGFSYTITATGDATITFTAAPLPAGLTLSGELISGTPTTSGSFVVTLGASNAAGSDTKSLVINVAPTGSSGSSVLPLTISKLAIKLNFAKPVRDGLSFRGTLPIAAGFSVAAKVVSVDVGGVAKNFTLNAKGSSPRSSTESFKIQIKAKKGVVAKQDAKYMVKFNKGNFAALLADEGLTSADAKNAQKTVNVLLTFDGQPYTSNTAQLYSAKAGKNGRTKQP